MRFIDAERFIYMVIKIRLQNPFCVFVSLTTLHGNGFQSLNNPAWQRFPISQQPCMATVSNPAWQRLSISQQPCMATVSNLTTTLHGNGFQSHITLHGNGFQSLNKPAWQRFPILQRPCMATVSNLLTTLHGNGFQSLKPNDFLTFASGRVLYTETAALSPRRPSQFCKKKRHKNHVEPLDVRLLARCYVTKDFLTS